MSREQLVRRDSEGVSFIRICVCRKCGYSSFPPVFLGCEHCGADGDQLEASWQPARGRILASATVPRDDGEIRI
ncbi:MAG: hypothetical protein HUJ31_17215, partial [Pseudomonadales bacterium]|nr:hypothetical protein [Pseudomonadales bacterium]